MHIEFASQVVDRIVFVVAEKIVDDMRPVAVLRQEGANLGPTEGS
jgi:hypothetical protein